MKPSGETQPSNTNANNNLEWASLENVPMSNRENENSKESFTTRELNRLAEATGRTPDDKGVIELNLALRYQTYRKYQQFYENAQKTNTMIQQGTMEDIATAKRELEEAMYLYDQNFGKADETQRRKEFKDSYRRHEDFRNGLTRGGNYFEEAQKARSARKSDYETSRQAMADDLADKLPGIVNNIENSEIYQTYELNKGPEQDIKERRAGFDEVGSKGFYGERYQIDWKLFPHAAKAESPSDVVANTSSDVDDEKAPLEAEPAHALEDSDLEGISEQIISFKGDKLTSADMQKISDFFAAKAAEAKAAEADVAASNEQEDQGTEEGAEEDTEEEADIEDISVDEIEVDTSTPEGREKGKFVLGELMQKLKKRINKLISKKDKLKAEREQYYSAIDEIDSKLARLNLKQAQIRGDTSQTVVADDIPPEVADTLAQDQQGGLAEAIAIKGEIKDIEAERAAILAKIEQLKSTNGLDENGEPIASYNSELDELRKEDEEKRQLIKSLYDRQATYIRDVDDFEAVNNAP